MHTTNEGVQSVISYGSAATAGASVFTLDAVAGVAESVTIILACLAVAVRLVYDVTRYIRYVRKKEKGK